MESSYIKTLYGEQGFHHSLVLVFDPLKASQQQQFRVEVRV